MTALGINVSTRDEVHGWESLQPKRLAPAWARYREARVEADTAWADYYKWWSDCGNQDETDRVHANCERLEAHAVLLMKQAECPHKCVEWEGGATTYKGEPDDNYRPVCQDCGAVIDL